MARFNPPYPLPGYKIGPSRDREKNFEHESPEIDPFSNFLRVVFRRRIFEATATSPRNNDDGWKRRRRTKRRETQRGETNRQTSRIRSMVYDTRFELAIRDDRFVIVEATMMTIESTKKKREKLHKYIYSTYVPRTEKSSRIFGKSKTKHDRIVDSPFASRPFVRSFVRRFTTLENSAAYLVPTNNFFSPSALGPILVARLVTTFRS